MSPIRPDEVSPPVTNGDGGGEDIDSDTDPNAIHIGDDAGGDLQGTYPNPTINPDLLLGGSSITQDDVDASVAAEAALRAATDTALSGSLTTTNSTVSALSSSLTSESAARSAADALKLNSSALDTDPGLLANSDTRIASQKATRTFVEGRFSATYFPEDYNAKGDGKEVHDGAISTGTAALTSPLAAFTTADVGKCCTVYGAAAAGNPLRTTISSVAGGTATLAAAASTTVTGAWVVWGTDDTVALQACIDAAMGAHTDAVVKLSSDATYLVESAPSGSRGGNGILSIMGPGFDKRIAIIGNTDFPKGIADERPWIRTTRFEDTYWNATTTTLASAMTNTDTSITLANASSFPSKGTVAIDFELIHYTTKTGNVLSGLTRPYMGGTAAAHSSGHTVKWTIGPPSVIGSATEENGGAPTTFPFTGLISVLGVYLAVPGPDPAIAGVDGIGWGGMHISAAVAAQHAASSDPPPSNPWAFGYRTPSSQNFGYVRFDHSVALHMYAGYVFYTGGHVSFYASDANRCNVGYAWESPPQLGLFGNHAVAGGYVITENNQYDLSGWTAAAGIKSLDVGEPVFVMDLLLDIEDQGAGGSPIHVANIRDINDQIHGNIKVRNVSGNDFVAQGGRNIRLELIDDDPITSTATANQLDVNGWDKVMKVSGATPPVKEIENGWLGQQLVLIFTSTAVVNHNDGTGATHYSPVLLNGGANFSGAANRTLTLAYDGAIWQEIGRKVP